MVRSESLMTNMKMLNQKQIATSLVVIGTLPFLVFAVLVIAGGQLPALSAAPALLLHTYSVIMGSFVAGLHWGIHFCKRTGDNVYLYSSFVALLLWCSMLAAGSALGLALALLGFLLLWYEEYRLSVQRVTTAWFWKLRTAVTVVVVLCLALSAVFA
jgi:hypothetical protein